MGFYEDMEKSLLEAIEIEKGSIPLEERNDMPAPTFFASDKEEELIDEVIMIRKEQGVSQTQLAKMTDNRQQAISRFESKEHSPSLKMFCNIVHALGCSLTIVKNN